VGQRSEAWSALTPCGHDRQPSSCAMPRESEGPFQERLPRFAATVVARSRQCAIPIRDTQGKVENPAATRATGWPPDLCVFTRGNAYEWGLLAPATA
jgi:hypothetical protein